MKRILDKSEFKTGKLDLPVPLAQPPKCPECTSQRVWKDGLRKTRHNDVQRWLCRDCGYRFSQNGPRDSAKPLQKDSSWSINSGSAYNLDRQVCEFLTEDSKNLARVNARTQKQVAGTTKLDKATIRGKLVEYAFFMQKEGYKPSTIKGRLECIKTLINRGAGYDLLNPEKIKEVIAKQPKWSEGYKANLVIAYTTFLAMHGMTWIPPRYKRLKKMPWIPLEKELDMLITTTGKRMSIFLQGLKETGADPGELHAIEWTDINPQARTVTINNPVKGHRPRIIDVSRQWIDRLNILPKGSEKVFQNNMPTLQKNFYNQRKRAAKKFNNPRLRKITFTTFRHWKATTEYHKTKDILWVMKLLGHNSLSTTLIYIDLEKAIFKKTNDEFTVRVAENLDEACKLLEVGFEYVTDMDGKKLFRKRK